MLLDLLGKKSTSLYIAIFMNYESKRKQDALRESKTLDLM